MRRRLPPLILVLALLAVATPAGGAGGRFATYLSCGAAGRGHDSVCSLGASPVAVLRSLRRAHVRYRVCVRRPSGSHRCRRKLTTSVGRRSRASIVLGAPGTYRVSWLAGGARLDRDRLLARAPRVFVNGDSLAVGTRPYLPHALPGWPISQSTSVSRHAPQGVEILRAKGARLARIVVMQLGTNDDPRADEEFHHSIRATMRIAGPDRCVVWPNIVRPPVAGTSYAGYNHALAVENRSRDNLFVVDWVEMARRHPSWFGPDGVHPNATGYMARARAIAEQVRRCLG